MQRSLHTTARLLSFRPWAAAGNTQQHASWGPSAALLTLHKQLKLLPDAAAAGAQRGFLTLGTPSTEALAAAGTLGLALNLGLSSLWARVSQSPVSNETNSTATASSSATYGTAAVTSDSPAAASAAAALLYPGTVSPATSVSPAAISQRDLSGSLLMSRGGGLMPDWGGLSRGGGGGGSWGGQGWFSRHPATNTILVTNVAMYALQQSRPEITLKLARINHLILTEPWRLLTPALLHGSLVHLALNSFSLYMMGPTVEEILGKRRFAAVYAASAVAGNALGWLMGGPGFYMAVGASTSISGLLGAYIAFRLLNRRHIAIDNGDMSWLAQIVGINALILMGAHNVDGWSHLGGALGGALTVMLLGPRPGRW